MKKLVFLLVACCFLFAGCPELDQIIEEKLPFLEPADPNRSHSVVVRTYEPIMQKFYRAPNNLEGLASLNTAQRAVFVLYTFDTHMAAGDFASFLSGEDGYLAEYISDSLKTVNATSHQRLFDAVMAQASTDSTVYEKYDAMYGILPSMTDLLAEYIDDNAHAFRTSEKK